MFRLLAATLMMTQVATVGLAQRQTIAEIVDASIDFATLDAALQAVGLDDALAGGDADLTVFAPTDGAFSRLPVATRSALLEPRNRSKLLEILQLHVVAGRVSAAQAVQAGTATTLGGGTLQFAIRDGRLEVNGAPVVQNDLAAANGVIHVIDRVLLPPEPRGRKVIGIFNERPGAALAAQLGLDRHASTLITRVSKDSGAAAAGLRAYDVIVAVDGDPYSDEQLSRAKQRAGVGGSVVLDVIRAGQRLTKTVEVRLAH